MKEKFTLKGSMVLTLRDKDGKIIAERRKDNLIVNVGFDLICDAIGRSASRPAVISHCAVGTGSVVPAAGDTTLGVELVRVAGTYAHTAGTKVFTFDTTFAAGVGTGALTETGIFNAVSVGTMLDRVTFSLLSKGAADSLDVNFSFTLS